MSEEHGRVHFIDWLRVLAVLGVFLFHAVHPFDTLDWHVKNADQSEIVTLVIAFLFPWGLGFFFLISGAGSYLALRRRTGAQFVVERVQRLLIPFVAGWVLLAPMQAFIEERHLGRYEGTFASFVPRFFADTWTEMTALEDIRPLIVPESFHLWFLMFLLWFSLLGLPLFLWFQRERGGRALRWLANHSDRRGSTLWFAVPIAALHVATRGASAGEHEWGEFIYYFGYFVAGYVLMSDRRMIAAVRRDLAPALALGVVGFVALMAFDAVAFAERWLEDPSYSWTYAAMFFVFSVQAWGWALAALNLGSRVRRFNRPLPTLFGATAMPFFVVHQPVILAIAYFVVGWDAGIAPKLASVLVSSFAASAALSLAATMTPGVRTLLGVKRPRARGVSAEEVSASTRLSAAPRP